MSQPIVLTNGIHEIKIYTVQNRGRAVFQLSYYEGGHRQRKTFGKVSVAKREAKLVLNRLAVNGHDAAELSTADMESYVVAKKHIEPTGLPLHVCAETFAQAHAKLAGRSASLIDAVDFYLEFHRDNTAPKSLTQLIADFADCRTAMGVAADYVGNIKRQLGRLAAAHPTTTLAQFRTADLDKWLGAQDWQPLTKNDVRKICITFGNWCKTHGYLPANRPTAFDGMIVYKVPATKIVIYTAEELRTILATVETNLPDLVPWVACAAFTGARVSELAILRWENINFDRGFVEIASHKVRSKARRLVPLHDALRPWLLRHRRESGLITDYADPRAALGRALSEANAELKDNGFRHSYNSRDTASLRRGHGLHCGNRSTMRTRDSRAAPKPRNFTATPTIPRRLGTALQTSTNFEPVLDPLETYPRSRRASRRLKHFGETACVPSPKSLGRPAPASRLPTGVRALYFSRPRPAAIGDRTSEVVHAASHNWQSPRPAQKQPRFSVANSKLQVRRLGFASGVVRRKSSGALAAAPAPPARGK